MSILGAVLSLAVIVGAIICIRRFRELFRYLDTEQQLARLAERPADVPRDAGPVRRLTVITANLRRRFQPRVPAMVASAWLVGVLTTATLFVTMFEPTAPAAERPEDKRIHVTTTVTVDRTRTTIARAPGGEAAKVSQALPPSRTSIQDTMSTGSGAGTSSPAGKRDPQPSTSRSGATATESAPPSVAQGPSSPPSIPIVTPSVSVAVDQNR